jgi:hypothetical protein
MRTGASRAVLSDGLAEGTGGKHARVLIMLSRLLVFVTLASLSFPLFVAV